MSDKQSFLKGTLILVLANTISKILGAVFKIPLTYILKEEGMAIYNTAFTVYITLLSFVISGVGLAVSKMVAQNLALGHKGNARKIVTVSTLLLALAGALGSAVMFFGAEFFAGAMKDLKATAAIRALSPAIFFVAVGVIYKSYYQGRTNMIPTAMSQVIEAVVKLVAGFMLALFFSRFSMEFTAAGAIFGVTIGEVIATVILILLYLPDRKRLHSYKANVRTKHICTSIGVIAIPMILSAGISSAMNLADITLIRSRLLQIVFTPESAERFLLQYASFTTVFDNLLETLRLSVGGARWLYGAYSGYALTIFHLPVGIMATLGVSILPVLAGAYALRKHRQVAHTATLAMKITILVILPCSILIALLAEPILALLFQNTASAGMLRLLSPCLVFVCVSQLLVTILNASGYIIRPFIHGFLGMCVKLLGNFFLISIPELNMMGVVLSANLGYLVITILDFYAVRKLVGVQFSAKDTFGLPLVCALVMGVVVLLLFRPLGIIFAQKWLVLAITCFVGLLTYGMMLFLTETITKDELKSLWGQKKATQKGM